MKKVKELKQASWYEKKKITDADFKMLSAFVTSNYGIKLPYQKKTMLEGRLQKRLKVTGIGTFKDYVGYIFDESGQMELIHMIDAISTNKTDFFREASHFDFMAGRLLPDYLPQVGGNLNIWSAAASTGEEIYTLAIVMEEYQRQSGSKINYNILGTDISTEALRKAITAVYNDTRIANIPTSLKKKYFLKSKDKTKREVRINAQLRSNTKFQRLNLMDPTYQIGAAFDIIFCRNVLIYFEKETQASVIAKLCDKLKPGGFLFLGHSESLIGKNLPLLQIKPTVYQRL